MSDARPFRFRLARILRLRCSEMRASELLLRRSEGEANRLEGIAGRDRLAARAIRSEIDETLVRGAAGRAHSKRMLQHELLARQSQQSADHARGAREETALRHRAWQEARLRVRGLERLRERLHRHFEREEEQRGQQTLDEIAVQKRRLPRLVLVFALALGMPQTPRAVWAETPTDEAASAALSADRLLLEIRNRQADFDLRERELEAREATVEELEARVANRIEELRELRIELATGLSSLDEESDLRVRQLAKMYSSMPPDRAAPLLEDIDRDLATAVLRRMKHKKSAAVMALLSKPSALALSRRVALPLVREEDGS